MSDVETLVAKDKDELAALGAEIVARAIVEAVQERGVARIALSGGSTPVPAYRRLAALGLPFDRVRWYWVDERAAVVSSERSNFGAAVEAFGVTAAAADSMTVKGRFHRMRGEAPELAESASEYERLLRAEFGVASAVAFDAMVMGIGDDGHTASLFPGLGAVAIVDRLVTDIRAQPEKGLEARISLTSPVICEARLVLIMASGAAKRGPIQKALAEGPEDDVPSRLFQRAKGRVVWLLDAAAAPGE